MKSHMLLVILYLFYSIKLVAQDKPDISFNHISLEDFSIAKLKADTSMGAVIIADVGSSSFEGNNKGWFTLVYKHQCRIKIINKKGYDLSRVEIPLYQSVKSDNKEQLENLKASTYNLVNGVVVESKLDKQSIFEEKLNKNYVLKKFTMPAVKEGSLIEFSYTIKSDFLFNLHPWHFQGAYPRVWSEYEVDIPRFFEYVYLRHGYIEFDIKTIKNKFSKYIVKNYDSYVMGGTKVYTITSNNFVNRWVIKNVPALKEEKFTTSINNHISAVEFQLSGEQFPDEAHKDIMGTWVDLSKELLKGDDFGKGLDKYNGWMNEDMKLIKIGTGDQLDQAKNIYEYIKNSIHNKGIRNIDLSAPLKEIFKTKSGYAEDINLLLIAMLRHQDIDAKPVILSTRANGIADEKYPLIQRFNYVICEAYINGKAYYLDASQPYLGFNKLPEYCYNGAGRVISDSAPIVYFNADSLQETKITSISLFKEDKKPGSWSGSVNIGMGYYESCRARNRISENGKEDFEKKLKASYTGNFSIEDIKMEDDQKDELPLKLSYNITATNALNSNIIYFNPMIDQGYTENIFTAAERNYPVEMSYKKDETYLMYIEIPEGYVVDEMPKPVKVSLNNGEGFFEYLIDKTDKDINLRSRIKLNKANFSAEDYTSLRNFFDYIVKKHAEQIVFKKK